MPVSCVHRGRIKWWQSGAYHPTAWRHRLDQAQSKNMPCLKTARALFQHKICAEWSAAELARSDDTPRVTARLP